ncbi:hypothetical protein CSA_023557, partial [Cucumis sativus]
KTLLLSQKRPSACASFLTKKIAVVTVSSSALSAVTPC